jgi:hypothetical protein
MMCVFRAAAVVVDGNDGSFVICCTRRHQLLTMHHDCGAVLVLTPLLMLIIISSLMKMSKKTVSFLFYESTRRQVESLLSALEELAVSACSCATLTPIQICYEARRDEWATASTARTLLGRHSSSSSSLSVVRRGSSENERVIHCQVLSRWWDDDDVERTVVLPVGHGHRRGHSTLIDVARRTGRSLRRAILVDATPDVKKGRQ